jgi:diketogulonate reductase-like aldo/keto reductase
LGISRDKLYITSKISPEQQGSKESREAVETIIKKLNCQYLDLILIHWPGVSKLKPEDEKNKDIRLQTW